MRTIALLTFTAGVFISGEALSAGPPNNVFYTGDVYLVETVICDTADQVESIMIAQREGGVQAGGMTYQALNRTRNAQGEPVCSYQRFQAQILETVSQWDNIPTSTGMTTAYVIYIVAPNGEAYAVLSSYPAVSREDRNSI